MFLSTLEKKIKINFNDKKILSLAFVHKSFDGKNNNEKLEFLGDRVLGFVIAKKLLEIYPNDNEGSLDKKLASLVNKKMCLKISKILNLEKFIKTGSSRNKNFNVEDKISSDTCEALIGAIFLDQGLKVSENFINTYWKKSLTDTTKTIVDSKTKLQEYSLKKFKSLPIYKLINNSGPKHKPIFKINVRIKGSKTIEGQGSSKKNAEQDAATKLIKKLNIK
tara:strand:- start:20 stop:682 length:663 start_codon:yes stop_codon:yes gene_type:complete